MQDIILFPEQIILQSETEQTLSLLVDQTNSISETGFMEMEEILVSDQVEHHQNSLLMAQHVSISDLMLLVICSIVVHEEILLGSLSVLQGKYSLPQDEFRLGEIQRVSPLLWILSLGVLELSLELLVTLLLVRLPTSHEEQFLLPMYKLLSLSSTPRRRLLLLLHSQVFRPLRPQPLEPIVLRLRQPHS